jgi:predicted nucleotidyltransferase
MLVFQLWDPANPMRSLDVFVKEPIAFDALLRDAVSKDIDGIPVRVASIEHLIEMKQAAGRPRDLDDIARLRQIQGEGEVHDEG